MKILNTDFAVSKRPKNLAVFHLTQNSLLEVETSNRAARVRSRDILTFAVYGNRE